MRVFKINFNVFNIFHCDWNVQGYSRLHNEGVGFCRTSSTVSRSYINNLGFLFCFATLAAKVLEELSLLLEG